MRLKERPHGDARPRGRLGGEPERGEEASHRVGFGDGADDPVRAGTARTHEHLDREHAAQENLHLYDALPAWEGG